MSFKIGDRDDEDMAALDAKREAARVKIWERAKPEAFPAASADMTEVLAFVWEVFPSGPKLRDVAEARFIGGALGHAREKGRTRDAATALRAVLESAEWVDFQSDLAKLRSVFKPRCARHWLPGGGDDFTTKRNSIRDMAKWVTAHYEAALASVCDF